MCYDFGSMKESGLSLKIKSRNYIYVAEVKGKLKF